MLQLDHAARATKGARNYQEDTAAVAAAASPFLPTPDASGGWAEPFVAVLADGMGGHVGGAMASGILCRSFLTSFRTTPATIPERLIAALHDANVAIATKIDENPMLDGMGTTMIGAAIDADGLQWVSVGDSPLFLFRRGEIAVLNEDHSLAPELDRMAELGHISHEAARNDPRRHMLRSAVTGEEIDLIDRPRKPLRLVPGDYVILASDGLQTLDVGEIERVVAAYAEDGATSVADALIRAIELAREPHQDNCTVVAIRVVDAG